MSPSRTPYRPPRNRREVWAAVLGVAVVIAFTVAMVFVLAPDTEEPVQLPPAATTIRLNYARGGGMMVRGALGAGEGAPYASLLIDTSLTYPMALAGSAWTKAGVPLSSLKEVPNSGSLRSGVLPSLRLGAFDVPHVPGLQGDGVVKERGEGLGVTVDGLLGSGLLATFRMTLIDGGRSMWLEDLPAEALQAPPPIVLPAESEVITDDETVDPDAEGEDDAPPAKSKSKGKATTPKPAPAAKKP